MIDELFDNLSNEEILKFIEDAVEKVFKKF